MVTRRVLGGWREASFEQQPFTSFIVDCVDRQREKNGEFIGKREIFSEPLNREITLSEVGYIHTHYEWTLCTHTLCKHSTHALIHTLENSHYIGLHRGFTHIQLAAHNFF